MKNIFISYSRLDRDVVKELTGDLYLLGTKVWYDQELGGGQKWWNAVLQQIRECDIFIVVVSRNLIQSEACMRELTYATDLNRTIFPVIINDVEMIALPSNLRSINFFDYRKRDKQAALGIAKALLHLPATEPLPDSLPESPAIPISYEGDQLRKLSLVVHSVELLERETQLTITTDLIRLLEIPELATEASSLLEKMLKRKDMLYSVAEDITRTLNSSKPRSHNNLDEEVETVIPDSATSSATTSLESDSEIVEKARPEKGWKAEVISREDRPDGTFSRITINATLPQSNHIIKVESGAFPKVYVDEVLVCRASLYVSNVEAHFQINDGNRSYSADISYKVTAFKNRLKFFRLIIDNTVLINI